jgi:Xaa-Pro aminopeptidase
VIQALGRERVFLHRSVVQEMKEVKNEIEISGMYDSHARDCGAAVFPRRKDLLMSVTYLRGWRTKYIRVQWLKNLMCPFSWRNFKSWFEIDLFADDRQRIHYIGPSFETMACTAINAATVEYVPQPDTCAYITSDSMFMLDAGANYKCSERRLS